MQNMEIGKNNQPCKHATIVAYDGGMADIPSQTAGSSYKKSAMATI